ncbi:MAG: hypothetical protein ACO2O6_01335 [Candidatus Hydrothermia bacterium]|jgi:hypothetical protein
MFDILKKFNISEAFLENLKVFGELTAKESVNAFSSILLFIDAKNLYKDLLNYAIANKDDCLIIFLIEFLNEKIKKNNSYKLSENLNENDLVVLTNYVSNSQNLKLKKVLRSFLITIKERKSL